ncbi:MAG: hypothetical protein IPP97_13805 [Candidatus Obscuribacter sp.]|nr:hypothetical protein [Candidatus Obscuribacter sp.]MBP6592835.1 hypothetical protein [Candidatus Obscuribacter sp.]MBP7577677.1 hypothetical protein [Candidatus Obscuribacter sp.]
MEKTSPGREKVVIPFYPLIYAALPALISYNVRAANQVPMGNLFLPLVLSFGVGCAIYGLCLACLRGARSTSLVAWAIVTALFGFTYIVVAFEFCLTVLHLPISPIAAQVGLIGLWTALIAVIFLALSGKSWIFKLEKMLAKFGTIIMFLELIVLSIHQYDCYTRLYPAVTTWQHKLITSCGANEATVRPTEQRPDIYLIITDEMASSEVLARIFEYDNTDFVNALKKRGFAVMNQSHSNYPITRMSIASITNLDYMDFLPPIVGRNCEDYSITNELLASSTLAQLLKGKGYSYINIGSEMPPTDFSIYADINKPPVLDEFAMRFLQSTAMAFVPDCGAWLESRRRETRLNAVEALANAPAMCDGPKFVFCHVLCPHEPFSFNANGNPIDEFMPARNNGQWDKKARDGYVGQVKFIENRVLSAIDRILASSAQRPIIVLQGDHGSCAMDEMALENPRQALYHERFSILNAYLVPEPIKNQLYDTITPVNSFRIILSQLFDFKLPHLEDRCYYTTYSKPFRLKDVSEIVLNKFAKVQ